MTHEQAVMEISLINWAILLYWHFSIIGKYKLLPSKTIHQRVLYHDIPYKKKYWRI